MNFRLLKVEVGFGTSALKTIYLGNMNPCTSTTQPHPQTGQQGRRGDSEQEARTAVDTTGKEDAAEEVLPFDLKLKP